MAKKTDFKSTLITFIVICAIGIPFCYALAIVIAMLSDRSIEHDTVYNLVDYIGNETANSWFVVTLGVGIIFLLLYFTSSKKGSDGDLKGQ